jgi:hypothetical protein
MVSRLLDGPTLRWWYCDAIMVRLQIQLHKSQHRLVRQRAARLGVSVSEVIRRSVDAQLDADGRDHPDERVRRALAVGGKYTDPCGPSTVAADHDAALAEAFHR